MADAPSTNPGPRRRRLLARLGLAAGAAVFALYLGLWGALISSGRSDGADFTAFYTGWTIVAEGDGANLYDPAFQAQVQERILGRAPATRAAGFFVSFDRGAPAQTMTAVLADRVVVGELVGRLPAQSIRNSGAILAP